MKAGIVYADLVGTVSRTYATEIQYDYFGENLDGLLRKRSDSLFGIVNGIDYNTYNPETDKNLVANYSAKDWSKKGNNKVALQQELGLPVGRDIPMIGMVTRLVEAKGLELLVRIMDELLASEKVQFVLLGTGDKRYEDWFQGLQWRFPNKVSANIRFSNKLAQQIYASSDIFLMPSVYEPCGIGQLIALRYGTIPLVRATGGLKDTVIPYNKFTGEGNGFIFDNINAHDMLFVAKQAIECYNNPAIWKSLINNAITSDYSWKKSALEYIDRYNQVLGK